MIHRLKGAQKVLELVQLDEHPKSSEITSLIEKAHKIEKLLQVLEYFLSYSKNVSCILLRISSNVHNISKLSNIFPSSIIQSRSIQVDSSALKLRAHTLSLFRKRPRPPPPRNPLSFLISPQTISPYTIKKISSVLFCVNASSDSVSLQSEHFLGKGGELLTAKQHFSEIHL